MFVIEGKHNVATIHVSGELESSAYSLVLSFLNNPIFANVRIAIMPDAHWGKGACIGFTAELPPNNPKVIPNVIGVDQGCAVNAWLLGRRSIIGEPYEKLDRFIKDFIPTGNGATGVREHRFDADRTDALYRLSFGLRDYPQFIDRVQKVAKATEQNADYALYSLGSLGGGNHFIEIDKDEKDNLWLVIHSGSRHFGAASCKWHQTRAENKNFGMDEETYRARVQEIKAKKKGKGIEAAIAALRKEAKRGGKKASGLEYLEGKDAQLYFDHLHVAQVYAQLSRRIMGLQIIEDFFKLPYAELEHIESVHNYINFTDRVIRKGAISAHEGENVVIPLNMRDGIVVGKGRGNPEWNNSAPHGAGRKMSRSDAKRKIDLSAFERTMRESGVWTSCVSKHTLDEAPQAYKDSDTIIEDIKEAVDITSRMWPTYNFKAADLKRHGRGRGAEEEPLEND